MKEEKKNIYKAISIKSRQHHRKKHDNNILWKSILHIISINYKILSTSKFKCLDSKTFDSIHDDANKKFAFTEYP